MKRSIVYCLVAAALLVLSPAAFAAPVSVSASGDITWDNTVTSGFNKSTGLTKRTITWFQPYEFQGKVPDFSVYPAGGTVSEPAIEIPSAKLMIKAWGVNKAAVLQQPAEKDTISIGLSSSGPWTAVNASLTPATAIHGQGDSLTTVSLPTDAATVKAVVAAKGFWVRVPLEDGNQDDYIKSAQLQVTAHFTYTYTYVPKKILFISAQHASTADANVPSDKAFVDLLTAAYYDVDYTPGSVAGTSYWETLDPNKTAALDAADLVIIARDCNSGGVATDAAEVAAWSKVKAPVMLMSSYIAANNRWKWINSNSQDARISYYMLKATDKSSPVFADVAFDLVATQADPNVPVDANDPNTVKMVPGDTVQWYDPNAASGFASFIKTADAGNGKVLAVRPDTGTILIAEWFPGKAFYATSDQIPANHRMFFNAGTQEKNGEKTNWGVMNLSAEGQKMFLNAVAYMIIPVPIPMNVVNASFELPGTVKIKGFNGEGIGGTPAVDIPGWATDVNSPVADSGVETGYTPTDGTWTAFLKGADPAIWQSTGFVIEEADVFALSVDARNTWQGKTLRVTLYYEDGAVRVPAATADVAVTDTMQTFTLPFAAKDVPACVGKVLGIELDNVTEVGDSWIGLDNVQLTVK